MNFTERKMPAPHTLPETEEYWRAADRGELLIKVCNDCEQPHFYPRDVCPHCMSVNTRWQKSEGKGEIYSFSTMARGGTGHTLAFVRLDEGVTMITNLVECDRSALAVGQRVKVAFVPTEVHAVPVFKPDQS